MDGARGRCQSGSDRPNVRDATACVCFNLPLCALFRRSLLASCATPKDVQHHVVISVKDQKLALLDHEKLVAIYPVSTSKYGLGDWRGSFRTPLGEMEIAQKVGDGMPPGTVFKDRQTNRRNRSTQCSRARSDR